MIFSGITFCGYKYGLNPSPTNINHIDSIRLEKGLADALYVTKDVTSEYSTTIPDWDFDTILSAGFNGSLNAGNVDYTVDQLTKLRVKVRRKGNFDWMTIYEKSINNISDLSLTTFFKFARSQTEYEFCIVPVTGNDEEGELMGVNTVMSEFDGVFVMDKDTTFKSIMEVEYSSQRNRPTNVLTPIQNKYGVVVSNGNLSYDTGNVSALFAQLDPTTCQYRFDVSWKYRKDLSDFLTNGRPKIIKCDNGEMWLVGITDNISHQAGAHNSFIITSIQWCEIADCESSHALYANGLKDLDIESW